MAWQKCSFKWKDYSILLDGKTKIVRLNGKSKVYV